MYEINNKSLKPLEELLKVDYESEKASNVGQLMIYFFFFYKSFKNIII
jgi:hypothetical protein